MRALTRIFRFTKNLVPLYLVVAVSSVLVTAGNIVAPFIIGRATDTVVAAVSGKIVVEKAVTTVLWLAFIFFVIDILNTGIGAIGGYFGDQLAQKMRSILSVRYFEKLLSLPQRYFDEELTGTITSRLNRSIMEMTTFVKSFANSFFTTLLTVVAVLTISFIYSPLMALLLLLVFPIYLWLTALTSKRWQRIEGQKNEHIDTAGGRFNEVIGQIRVVKSFTREAEELSQFSDHYTETEKLNSSQSGRWHLMDFLRRSCMALLFFGIYAIVFTRTAQGIFSVGDMVILVQLVALARRPVMNMSWIVDTTQHAIAGSKDYFNVMELDPHTLKATMDASASQGILEKGSTVTLSGKIVANEGVPAGSLRNGLGVYGAGVYGAGVDGAGAGVDSARVGSGDASGAGTDALADSSGSASDEVVIDFSHITFGYGNDPDVLRDVSFTVRRGEKIAFVSESGGGKTTLTSLLLGLYEPRHGKIFVDGKNIGDMTPIDVRSRIGVVFQDAALFSGTVRENIAYGRPEASDEEIHDAAQRAHADRFIRRFKDGYDTVIGERGLKLSGGQRQRIAVARAMLKGAEILILDEATSALDTRSERWVQAGLEELMKNRTSIIIAHRLSTIATVDRIITLRDGKIDEVGSPAELAVSGGIYSELLALQNEGSAQARKHLRRYGFR